MNQYFGIYFMAGFTVDFPKIRYQVCRRIAKLKTLYTFTPINANSFFSAAVHGLVVCVVSWQHPIHLRNL